MRAELTISNGRLRVTTPYSPVLVDRFRTIPGRQWDPEGKAWTFPLVKDVLLMVADAVGLLPDMLPGGLRDMAGTALSSAAPAADMTTAAAHQFLTPPYEHQRRNLAILLANPRWLICDEQGCGKSHSIANRLTYFDPQDAVLIVCPKSVMEVWRTQLEVHAGLECELVVGNPVGRRRCLMSRRNIKVVNYEAVVADFDAFDHRWVALVLDEVHRCKGFTSQTCRSLRKLSLKAGHVWGLSGTPAPNGLEDWLGVISVIDPELLPVDTKLAFEDRYCVKTRLGDGGPWVVSGYRNVADLHGHVQSITSRVTKDQALDLPPKVHSVRTCRLAGEQARVYRDLKRDAVARLESLKGTGRLTVANVLTESLRLLQVVGGFVPDDSGTVHELPDKCKVEALAELLEEVGDRQVVVWCAFRAEVKYLCAWLEELTGARAVPFLGDMDSTFRADSLERFRSGSARFFVATAATGGTGINGLEVADTEVYYSRDWNLATYLQSKDRLHRIGQRRPVSVVRMVAAGTVDARVEEALDSKASLQELLLRRPEDVL